MPASEANTKRAEELAGEHDTCEDGFYSCPASGECLNDEAGDKCDCGRDRRVESIATALDAAEARGAARLRERIRKVVDREVEEAARSLSARQWSTAGQLSYAASVLRGLLEEEG